MAFDPNKRGTYPVVRSQWPGFEAQERKESVYAIVCISAILLALIVFLVLAYIAD